MILQPLNCLCEQCEVKIKFTMFLLLEKGQIAKLIKPQNSKDETEAELKPFTSSQAFNKPIMTMFLKRFTFVFFRAFKSCY